MALLRKGAQTGAASGRRRKKTNYSWLILATGLFIFAAAAGALYLLSRPVTLRIAVGPPGSEDQKLIQELALIFARDGGPVRLMPIAVAGGAESIAQINAGKADLAVARADTDMPKDMQSVAILRKNVVVLWAPAGLRAKNARKDPAPKIKGLDDLPGHRVGIIGRSEANATLLRVILTESGINPDKVVITQFGTDQIAELTRDMSVDAFMTVGPLDSKITADAIASTARARGEPKFLAIDVSEAIARKRPLYESEEIPGSTFSASPARPEDKIDTVGVNHLIVAPKKLSETKAGAFVRQLFTVRPSLAKETPAAAKIMKPETDKDAALPAHPGAAAYFEGTERTFLEKYSDYMWAAILLLSGLGSGGAWLRHYFRRDEREQNALHRDRLLETIAKVREVESLSAMAAIQYEVDDLLRETLHCYDDGAIEDGDLAAFGLVLQQLHNAVLEKRAALGATA